VKYLSRTLLAVLIAGSSVSLLASAARVQVTQDPEVQFQRAVQLETIEGNLNAAIDLYKQVIKNNGNNRALAARALLRLGGCYERQGNAEASKAYEVLLRDYADQADLAVEARTRLSALRKPAGAESGPSTRRIWAESKTDFFGAVSPDGKYLSFVDWETGDLAVRNLAEGTNRRLTDKGSWESNPDDEAELSIWSPDSKQIAYQWSTSHGYELRGISLDKPTPQVLYRCESTQEWVQPHDWSPDGKHILATLNKSGADQQVVLLSVGDGTVRSLKKFSQSLSLRRAAISPDGHYVVYAYPQSESSLAHDIFLLPIAGGSETPLVEYPADDVVLGWAPDGKSVLFASDRRGTVDIWAIRTEDGKPKGAPRIVRSAVGRMHPLGFTRSGSFYFGVGGARNNVDVVKLDPATGSVLVPQTRLVQRVEGFNRSPQYSPDGKYLAYISKGAGTIHSVGPGWGDSLNVRSLETGEEREYQREITRLGVTYLSSPRWSPEGRSILLFGRDRRGRYGMYRVNLETGKTVCVLNQPEGQFIDMAGWRDGSNFLYGRLDAKNDRGEICLRNLDTGNEKVLFSTSAIRGALAVSPDRRWVSATESYESGEHALRILSTDSGALKQVIKFTEKDQFYLIRHAWSADSRYVLYTRRVRAEGANFKFELWRVRVDGGQPERTAFELSGTIDHISAHPDGEHIAFENMAPMSESPAEVWVLADFLPKQE